MRHTSPLADRIDAIYRFLSSSQRIDTLCENFNALGHSPSKYGSCIAPAVAFHVLKMQAGCVLTMSWHFPNRYLLLA